MVALLGRRTEMPVLVGVTLVSGTWVWMKSDGLWVKKWAVAPVSATIGGGRVSCFGAGLFVVRSKLFSTWV